jgi:ribose transport system permease protein
MKKMKSTTEVSFIRRSLCGLIREYIKQNIGIIVALFVLILVVSLSAPSFLTKANMLNLLRANAVNAIICCGMLMAVLMGEIDISVGSTVGLSGVIGAYLITNASFPVWLTLLCCILTGLAVGVINGISVSYFGIPAFVASLATMSIGRGLTAIVCGGISIRIRNDIYSRISSANIGGLSMIIIYALVIIFLTWTLLNRTRFGYYIYAIGGNKLAAQYSGINTKLYNLIPYLLIGMFSALGGIIWSSRLGSAAATLGQGFEMDAIAAVVIGGVSMSGGVGTVGGMVIGVLIVGVITNGLNLMSINPFWQEVFKGIIILAAVIVDMLRKRKMMNEK